MRRGLLATRDELRGLKDRLGRKPFDALYAVLHKRCSLILQTSPVTEAQWRMLSQQGSTSAALNAARTAQGRMLDLLIAHHIDANPAYRDRAIEELKNLLSWSSWVDPAHSDLSVDMCTAESAVAAVIGLDWLWEDLTEVERLRVLHALRNKVITPYNASVKKGAWWYNCYHSWNAVVNSGCGLVALALSDEESPAREALTNARTGLKHFLDAMGREGGWDEGLSYWATAMRYFLLFAEGVSQTTDDLSLFHTRGLDATGLFPVYFTPNAQHEGFGDAAAVPLYGAFYLLTKHFAMRELTWWLDTYAFHRDVTTTGYSGAGLAMLCRPVDAETVVQPGLQTVKVFNEIGWVAMADHWPKPSFYVAAKTGDLSANHGRPDMCSLNLQVDGETLLVDRGLPPYHFATQEEANSELTDVQAASHNVLLIGRRDYRIDGQGTIVEAQADGNFRWAACDSGTAMGENVHFIRHVVIVTNDRTHAGRMLVVLDELANTATEAVDLFWHTPGLIQRTPDQAAGLITGLKSTLHFAMASTVSFHLDVLRRETNSRAESILHAHVPRASKLMMASVFSREAIRGEPEIRKSSGNDIRVRAGAAILQFKSSKRHLQLVHVTGH